MGLKLAQSRHPVRSYECRYGANIADLFRRAADYVDKDSQGPIVLNNVRFWVNSGHDADLMRCPLLTRFGTRALKLAVVHNGLGRLVICSTKNPR